MISSYRIIYLLVGLSLSSMSVLAAEFDRKIAEKKVIDLVALAKAYTKLGWAMQIHFGAIRNNNTKMFNQLGPDAGFD